MSRRFANRSCVFPFAVLLLLAGVACAPAEDPVPGDLEARGNEPFWGVSIDGDEARVTTPEELDGILYYSGSWEQTSEGKWRYEAERMHADGVEYLTLDVVAGPCIDTMSGAEFPYSASLRWSGRQMTGCAGTGEEGRGA